MKNFKLKTLSAAVLGALVATPIYAAEPESNNDEAEVEVIEIKGFRGSLKKAVNAKRFSESVSDSIHAEDVGKSTDQNIADALSRVTGVSVVEEDGEGTRISVRGTSPYMNQISINGVSLTAGLGGNGANGDLTGDQTADQSVDLSSFSSDILSSIDVVKTSSADQDEGSLGASVILRTMKPLSLNEPRRVLSLEGRYNEFSGEYDGRFSTTFADKFADDTFGVVFSVSGDQQKTRTDSMRTSWEGNGVEIVDLEASSGRTAHDVATGKAIRVLGYQRDSEGELLLDDAGNPMLNDVSTLLNYNPDEQIIVNEDLAGGYQVMARDVTDIAVASNVRERLSATAGFEWEPTDSTNIQLDLTHTQRKVETDYNNFRLNFAVGAVGVSSADPVTDWNGVDLETRTLQKSYNRLSSGFFNRSQGTTDIETNVASLTIEQQLTDSLQMTVNAGYSETTEGTDDFVSITTATWGTIGNSTIGDVPADHIEPIGVDCTVDAYDCMFGVSNTNATIDPFDGSMSYLPSRFSVFDLNANHLGHLTFRDNEQSDINTSVRADFDWELEGDYLTSLEFGFKYAKREKDVHTQNEQINTGTALVDNSNPNIEYATVGMQSIGVVDMLSSDAFPYDNFGQSLTDHDYEFLGGWPMLDSNKAVAEFSGREPGSVGLSTNNLGTRYIETETKAVYLKLNFEALDGELTGNIGVRAIQDANVSNGYGGITYYRPPHLLDPYNLLIERGLGNLDSPACPEPVMGLDPDGNADTRYEPQNSAALSGCFDWALTHAYNRDEPTTIPYVDGEWVYGDRDVNRLAFIDYSGDTPVVNQLLPLPNTVTDVNGATQNTPRNRHMQFASSGTIWQYLDRSTSFTGPAGNTDVANRREAVTSGAKTHDLLLPSLNLNYAMNEEMIVRFAASKTMTRPRFDSLNPRLQINENIWDTTATGAAGNAELKPLQSTNLDFSFEWYFNDSGIISAAIYHKDIVDMEEEIVTPYHYLDVRDQYELESANLLLPFDENRMPGDGDNCQQRRFPGGFSASEWYIGCHVANIDVIKNGLGATVAGLELTYTQNYDFLPGLLSGLGLSANYTYQTSEKDPEEIGTSGVFLEPQPMELTPENSANVTLFYEYSGLSLRFAHRYTDVQLVDAGLAGGAIWLDETNRADFSATYDLTDNISFSFNMTNVFEDVRREFYTANAARNTDQEIFYDEGNAIENDVTDERTVSLYDSGRQYRFGVRVNF